jgi:hypothetical protein
MKNLLEKIFKKQPQFNYIIAEYPPGRIIPPKGDLILTEYDIDVPDAKDEMEIDKIYQSS